ncbi:hypothetical protein [Shewanella algicola]|uniref:hypothetical protein n=1 Tax=Shewanella algicola TaxID=640633 RepID=UPI0024945CF0|nr:hypothetical protein [Shewanella algicola]
MKIQIAYEISVTNFDGVVSSLTLITVIGFAVCYVAWWLKPLKHRTFLLFWGVCAGIGGALLLGTKVAEHLYVYTQYSNDNYELIEGTVNVLRLQPEHGHAAGDLIEIAGQKLEVDYFTSAPGYHISIANGGVLQDGVYARVYVYDGLLLKIEHR